MAKSKKIKEHKTFWDKLKEFAKSTDFARFRGAVYILFSVFLFIAVISFFFSGADPEGNICGRLGGAVASFFVKKIFGVASLGFSLLFFVYGVRLWGKELMPWWRTLLLTVFWMAWFSVTIGLFSLNSDNRGLYEGTFGSVLANVLHDALKVGAPVLQIFIAIVALVFAHHIRFKRAIKIAKSVKENLLAKRAPREVVPATSKESDNDTDDIPDDDTPPVLKVDEEPDNEEPDDDDMVLVHKGSDPTFTIVGNDDVADDEPRIIHRPHTAETPAHAEPATDDTANKDDGNKPTPVTFDIDDEFARVNQRARDMKEAGAIIGTEGDGKQDDKASNGVAFTVIDTGASQSDGTTQPPADKPAEEQPQEDDDPDDYGKHFGLDEPFDPKLELRDFQMPSTDMLVDYEVRNEKVTNEELVANKNKIVDTLHNYGIEIVEISASPGPTVTLYEIRPAPGIRIAKIKNLEDDIALSLAALGIRIIAPIPGRGTIGIEVPNAKPQVVSMRTMLNSDAFVNNTKYELPIAFGKTISNEPYVTDLAKMPHLLMAGATGTGKSVGINAVIASLLYKKHPAELKFVMVDPKKVELSIYNKIERHYLAKLPDSEEPIITDVKKVVRTLNSLCIEMDNRYDLLKQAHVRNLKEYNPKFIARKLNPENGHHFMPYIVLVIDEFADLIMTAGKEVELPIARLAQLARAVGIHLIIATQRPTTNIITGTIKANFPARVAFRVTSAIDSRTILDTGGANQLIGRGDMLISLAGSDLVRIQCALIETEECDRITEFIAQQRGYSDGFLLPEYIDENDEPNKDFDPKQKDEFFNDAARLVVASQFGSTSLLQRKLQLGYNRAGRIIDQLEATGIVGPYNGAKAREVLVKSEVELEEILRNL